MLEPSASVPNSAAWQPLTAASKQQLLQWASAAMRSHGMRPDMSPAALHQAEAAARVPVDASAADATALPWISIDNDDSQDLDQLSVVEPLPGGAMRLNVAVADVAALVQTGDAIDSHAAHNTVTVYTDAGLFPMLPTALSHQRTSLLPQAEREALVACLQVAPDGQWRLQRVLRARVRSCARLSYERVAEFLLATSEGQSHKPRTLRGRRLPLRVAAQMLQLCDSVSTKAVLDQVRWHDLLAQRLHQARQQAGALLLDTEELRAVRSDAGELIDWQARVSNRAHTLIAEVMIAANQALAQWLANAKAPQLLRVLPPPRHWDRLVELAAQHGQSLPSTPDAPALATWLRERRAAAPAQFADLSLQVVKMLGGGTYVAVDLAASTEGTADDANHGHFALAVHAYTHATAPNRRYADVLTHRQVRALLAGDAPPYDLAALQHWAAHCAQQDGAADKVARQVRKSAMALMLAQSHGRSYPAIVTGASPKAVYVRTRHPLIEGRLVQGEEGLLVGDRLTVRLLAVDAEQGHIDFTRD